MATSAVVTATYKTITAILEANDITWRDIIDRHQDQEWREKMKLQEKVKVLEDQLFNLTDGGNRVTTNDFNGQRDT